MAIPRERGGNHSSTALPLDGFSTLKPKPATTSAPSSAGRLCANAAATTSAPISSSPPPSVRRTPNRSVSQPAGSDISTPPR
jgi:hypothetical protein